MTNKKINKTPSHRLNKKIRDKLKAINTSAFVDVMARQFGYNPRYVLMNNVKRVIHLVKPVQVFLSKYFMIINIK